MATGIRYPESYSVGLVTTNAIVIGSSSFDSRWRLLAIFGEDTSVGLWTGLYARLAHGLPDGTVFVDLQALVDKRRRRGDGKEGRNGG